MRHGHRRAAEMPGSGRASTPAEGRSCLHTTPVPIMLTANFRDLERRLEKAQPSNAAGLGRERHSKAKQAAESRWTERHCLFSKQLLWTYWGMLLAFRQIAGRNLRAEQSIDGAGKNQHQSLGKCVATGHLSRASPRPRVCGDWHQLLPQNNDAVFGT